MPRFYFHVFNDESVLDEEGAELPDWDAARNRAIESAGALACDSIQKGHLNLDHRIEVVDESDKRIMTVTFREAFTIEG
jgi:hypothetical protein